MRVLSGGFVSGDTSSMGGRVDEEDGGWMLMARRRPRLLLSVVFVTNVSLLFALKNTNPSIGADHKACSIWLYYEDRLM
jgi:hypothetical protein